MDGSVCPSRCGSWESREKENVTGWWVGWLVGENVVYSI